MHFTLLTLGALVSYGLASPTSSYALHEKRNALPSGWSKRDQLDRRAVMPMKIALKQRNIERGWEFLEEVSHPESAKYGQHWTAQEVAEMFSPRYVRD